jgi:hypothetical protein
MELFLKACNATGLSLDVEHHGRQTSTRYSLYQPFAVIGRDQRADICLLDPGVRKRHAFIHSIAGRTLFIDLPSRAQSEPPERFKRTKWLESAATIQVGPYDVHLADGNSNGKAMAAANAHDRFEDYVRELPKVGLRISQETGNTLDGSMTGVVALLGRSTGGPVSLVSRTVSSAHCLLIRTPDGLWVVDLLGRGGTWVNGAPIRYARLEKGDRLGLGKFLVEVTYETPALSSHSRPFHSEVRGEACRWDNGDAPAQVDLELLPSNDEPFPISVPFGRPELNMGQLQSGAKVPGLPDLLKKGTSLPVATLPQLAPVATAPMISQEQLLEVLTPFATQFRLMQQQMFEQFQQSLLTMFDMFSTLHRDQTSAIRQELDDLKRVTQEIQELRKEMTRRSMPVPETTSQVPFDQLTPIMVATYPSNPSMRPVENPTETTMETKEDQCPKPTEESPVSPLSPDRVTQPFPEPVPVRQPVGPAPEPAVADGKAKSKPIPGPEAPNSSIHDWLSERMTQLQREQQSRWQRLLRLLTGR